MSTLPETSILVMEDSTVVMTPLQMNLAAATVMLTMIDFAVTLDDDEKEEDDIGNL